MMALNVVAIALWAFGSVSWNHVALWLFLTPAAHFLHHHMEDRRTGHDTTARAVLRGGHLLFWTTLIFYGWWAILALGVWLVVIIHYLEEAQVMLSKE